MTWVPLLHTGLFTLLASFVVAVAMPATAHADSAPVDVIWRDGLRFQAETDNGPVEIRVGGRIHFDTNFGFANLEEDASEHSFQPRDGYRIRRARLQLRGSFFDAMRFNLHIEFASGSPSFKDAHFGFQLGPGEFVIGLQRSPASFINVTGANNRPMMESNFVNQLFAPSRQAGLSYNASLKDNLVNGSVAFYRVVNGAGNRTPDQNLWLAGTRLWFSLLGESEGTDLHLGASANHWFLNDSEFTFRSRAAILVEPGDRLLTRQFGDDEEGAILGLDGNTVLGAEAAFVHDRLRLIAEFGSAITQPRDDDEASAFLWGVSATVGYLLNDGSQRYHSRRGRVRNPNVVDPLGSGRGVGIFEVVAQFDYADLSDGLPRGAPGVEAVHAGLGLNWYMHNNMRLQFNLAMMHVNGDGTYYLLGTRFQVNI